MPMKDRDAPPPEAGSTDESVLLARLRAAEAATEALQGAGAQSGGLADQLALAMREAAPPGRTQWTRSPRTACGRRWPASRGGCLRRLRRPLRRQDDGEAGAAGR